MAERLDHDPEAEPADRVAHAVGELGREVRRRLGISSDEAEGDDWIELFDELRRRTRTLGMSERNGEVDDFGFDPEQVARMRPLLDFLRDRWWRLDVAGSEWLPEDGPVLFVANRSGILPYDALMLAHVVAGTGRSWPRFLVADWLATAPFAQSRLASLGGVRACRENAERLLASGRSVIAFPEGLKGAAKVFRDRYRLQRFGRGGAVRLALDAGVPLVPVAVVGAEEVHPILFKMSSVARLAGLPFVPVTPTFPWLGPLGLLPLPSKWLLRFGEPLETARSGPGAGEDELAVSRLNEELRTKLQEMIDAAIREREGVFA